MAERQESAALADQAAAGDLAPSNGDSAVRAAELRDLLASRRGERHIVAIQDFPDPDAISSALAYRELALPFEIYTDVVYDGTISHPQNLALVNLLDIEIVQYKDGMALDQYDAAIFVDNQGATTRLTARLRDAEVRTLAVIDHHEPHDLLDPIFSDIRPFGAAATVFAQYLRSGVFLQLEPGKPRHIKLATALMHGLHSETDSFMRAGQPEFEAAAYLSPFGDAELLERVLCVKKSRGTMDIIQAALSRRVIRSGVSVAGVGYVRGNDRDAIPQAADFLLTEENVNTVVVYGVLRAEDGREVISGSLRTRSDTLGVDAYLKRALGNDLRGRPYGGGRHHAGGFEIELGFLGGGADDREQADMKWVLFDRQIRRKLFAAAGVEEEELVEKPGGAGAVGGADV